MKPILSEQYLFKYTEKVEGFWVYKQTMIQLANKNEQDKALSIFKAQMIGKEYRLISGPIYA